MAPRLAAPPGGWPLPTVAEALEVHVDPAVTNQLGEWLDTLAVWNERVDLTAARGVDELVDLMVVDALVLSKHTARGATVVDVGTGAGAPGLPLAILRPDLRVTLVEPLAKRASFLRSVLGTIDRLDVSLEAVRGETLSATGRTWDVALARATLPPPAWLALGADLVSVGGSVYVFLAKEPIPTHGAMSLEEQHDYVWPLTGASRRLVRFARLGGRVEVP